MESGKGRADTVQLLGEGPFGEEEKQNRTPEGVRSPVENQSSRHRNSVKTGRSERIRHSGRSVRNLDETQSQDRNPGYRAEEVPRYLLRACFKAQ